MPGTGGGLGYRFAYAGGVGVSRATGQTGRAIQAGVKGAQVGKHIAWVASSQDEGSIGDGKTKHGSYRATQRGFSNQRINDIVTNYSHKGYQPGGRTIYAKKYGNRYEVVILNKAGEVVSTVGGRRSNTLRTFKDVIQMAQNQGGWYSLPID